MISSPRGPPAWAGRAERIIGETAAGRNGGVAAGPTLERPVLGDPVKQVMVEGVHAGERHVGIGGEIGRDHETRRRIAPFLPAIKLEMEQGIDPRRRDVGILLQVPAGIENRIGISSLAPAPLSVMQLRIYAG